MKQRVWKNKSNEQLCITIPKNSGLAEGDYVEVKKSKINCITYSGVVGDLFHYGHLQSIKFAKSLGDLNVVGVITDEAVENYRARPIANLKERKAVIESLNCVDRVMTQRSRDHSENLKKIHEEFPEAEIILVHGDDLEDIPGVEYLKSIGGRIVKHPYYKRLSTYSILSKISNSIENVKDIQKFASLIKGEQFEKNKTIISSKTDTLKELKKLLKKSKIEDIYSFTSSDWKNNHLQVLEDIQKTFSSDIVVRSSAINEDTLDKSMAGCFESVIGVNVSDKDNIQQAIEKVLKSYSKKDSDSSFNQVLVQTQTKNIVVSGVIFTRTLEKNAPYYVINYDNTTGSTESVTAGRENKMILISHFTEDYPREFAGLLEAVKEIEELTPNLPLDIEFAINHHDEIIIFQVRPLAANINKNNDDLAIKNKLLEMKNKYLSLSQKQEHLAGETTFFADMPDWNPAEIIGNNPNHLDYTLYDYIITNSAWHEARSTQGYYNVKPAKLVELFGNKPFINVRNTFNSFTPATISHSLRNKLVSFYLNKLKENPFLQDKVEFEILYTCYDLNFSQKSAELLSRGFSSEEIIELKNSLLTLTNNLISDSLHSIEQDIAEVFSMEIQRQRIKDEVKFNELTPSQLISRAKVLLNDCRNKGTVQFSRMARLGFIAKIILKSLLENDIITTSFFDGLYNSINTVASEVSQDFLKFCSNDITKDQFLEKYGHLRPGTYDITSLRYDANPHLLKTSMFKIEEKKSENFNLSEEDSEKITNALRREGLAFAAEEFIGFCRKSTEARELTKFEFTKNLSEALELIAKAGEMMGFTRKEISLMDINDILTNSGSTIEMTGLWKNQIQRREKDKLTNDRLNLPSVIFSDKDFDIIKFYEAKPNFITQKKAEAKIINITTCGEEEINNIEGSIVLLENGDPGYDWIFTRNPKGLITKYGGVASHMSIRCAEFGIPAAIGCGEMIFNQIKNVERVHLDCQNQKITTFRN